MEKLFLLDAYALIYRAYYAFIKNPRINSKGFNTSAIMGFVNTLEDVLKKENPTHIGIAFDPAGPTFRHEAFEQYKAQREETPEAIRLSVPIIKDIIRAYRIPILEVSGYEADDVIGTLATEAGKRGITTYMMTPDKDYGQLVSENVFMYRPKYGDKEFEVMGVNEIKAKFDIDSPSQVIDMLGLMGDTADNIPGCPGVGEKTAQKLIAQFGSIENLLAHTDELKGAIKKKVEENNFGIRKRLLEYDDVMNKQRTVVYTKRRHALMGERIGMDIVDMIWERCYNAVQQPTYEDAKMEILQVLAMEAPFTEEDFRSKKKDDLAEQTFQEAMALFKRKTERMAQIANPVIKQVYEAQGHMYENIMIPITDGKRMYNISVNLKAAYESESKEIVKSFEKAILLHTIDDAWKENLRELDELKHSVQNASYEQKDPLLIFKLESVNLFDNMVNKINNNTISVLMRGQIPVQEPEQVREAAPEPQAPRQQYREEKQDLTDPDQREAAGRDTREQKQEPYRAEKTVGRNDPCPCGSGLKYKNCHGKNA